MDGAPGSQSDSWRRLFTHVARVPFISTFCNTKQHCDSTKLVPAYERKGLRLNPFGKIEKCGSRIAQKNFA
jgi:hypothetical protein